MKVTVDHLRAEQILRQAIYEVQNCGWQPTTKHAQLISRVISGTHKTYRYVLVNGLLAKASNELCNPLVLQAGSELDGAFDARSLCHGVLVPIERELLGSRIGASNEPFLNKPARFPELSPGNAVRRGSDSLRLQETIQILENIASQDQAYAALKDALYCVFQRPSRDLFDYVDTNDNNFQQSSLMKFAENFISQSFEGESCAILSGAIFEMFATASGKNLIVKTHKVNQAGTSSNEVSDIDVYENGSLLYTAEVKDKPFSTQDVEHALSKVVAVAHRSLIFIKGPRGVLLGASEAELISFWKNKGIELHFLGILEYLSAFYSIARGFDNSAFLESLNRQANHAKVKDETFEHLRACAQSAYW